MAKSDAQQDGPSKDTQVVGVRQGIDGVRSDGQHQLREHRTDVGGGSGGVLSRGQRQVNREQRAHKHGHERRDERCRQVQDDDHLHGAGALGVSQRADDQEEHEDGRHALQSRHEQRAEHLKHVVAGPHHAQDGADDKAHQDALDQADGVPLPPDRFQSFHSQRSFPPVALLEGFAGF